MTAIPIRHRAAPPSPAARRRGPSRIPVPAIRVLLYAPGMEPGRLGLALAHQVSAVLPEAGVLVVTDLVDDLPDLPASVQWHLIRRGFSAGAAPLARTFFQPRTP